MHSILVAVGRRIGVPVRDARLLRLHSNAILALPSAGLLVRIATNPDALASVRAAVAVTRWLAARGFPCVANAIEERPDAMSDAQRRWLRGRIAELREQWPALALPRPPGLIHGDAHPNNLMRSASGGILLGDWDHVAVGPREWDLAQVHYTRRRFGRPSKEDIEGFTSAYGWDIRTWTGLETMIAVREVTGLSAYIRTAATKASAHQELAQRLETLQCHDTAARWASPPPE